MPADAATLAARRARAAAYARGAGIGAVVVAAGPDLTYLTGHHIHESERLTCLVLASGGAATLIVPELEAPRARAAAPGLEIRTWTETDDPLALAISLIPHRGEIAVGDRMWATFALGFQKRLAERRFRLASNVIAPLRMRKDKGELAVLLAAAEAADRVFAKMRERPFAERSESDVSRELRERLAYDGHDDTFAIVASGPNGASPHHAPGDRLISPGDTVVLDFGGSRDRYCSDITRTVHIGDAVDPEVRTVHDIVLRAQLAGFRAARAGVRAEAVDAAARAVIDEAGYGKHFIHRLGHGIGLDGHEPPYLVSGNDTILEPGMAFSIEPGIYIPGRFGVRIEDIAFIDAAGVAQPLNTVDHGLAIVH